MLFFQPHIAIHGNLFILFFLLPQGGKTAAWGEGRVIDIMKMAWGKRTRKLLLLGYCFGLAVPLQAPFAGEKHKEDSFKDLLESCQVYPQTETTHYDF